MENGQGIHLHSVAHQCGKAKLNVLECRVCQDVFSLQGDKIPRLLYCGHTLCHSCLLHLTLLEGNVICPFDRQPTPTGNSGIWGLKKNFALLELLEKLSGCSNNWSLYNSALLEKEKQLSIPCDENEDHIAVLYCTVCGSHLCSECSERTHATRTLERHRRVPLSEKPREKPRCIHHPSQLVEYACLEESCQISGTRLMCFICREYGRHKSHKHALLEVEAESLRSLVSDAVQHFRKLAEDMGKSLHKMERVINQIEGPSTSGESSPDETDRSVIGTAETAHLKIQAYFEELREQLRLQEVAALTVVETHVRERLSALRQRQEDLALLISQVAAMCSHWERVVQQDDARMVVAGSELRDMLASIEKQQQQFGELEPEALLDPTISITFTKDNRVHIGPKLEMRVVTLGLDGSGKTSILFKLKQDELILTIPTIGFNVETIEYKNLKFTVWDVGGQPKLRPLWKHYYLNTQAVIYVVDSSDRARLSESHNEIIRLMSEKELKDASFLIFANKQDIEGCASIEEITDHFSLHKLCCGRGWHIQGCDVRSGAGLKEGLDWLSWQLSANGVMESI